MSHFDSFLYQQLTALQKPKDLLGSSGVTLELREDLRNGVFVAGLEEVAVSSMEQVAELLALGQGSLCAAAAAVFYHLLAVRCPIIVDEDADCSLLFVLFWLQNSSIDRHRQAECRCDGNERTQQPFAHHSLAEN